MKHIRLNKEAQWDGVWTDLFILGTTRAANGATDFSAAGLTQNITLLTPKDGDTIVYPSAQAYTKIAFAGDSVSALALDVGFSNGEEFIKDAAMVSATGVGVPHATDSITVAAMVKRFDGSIALTASLTKTGGTQLALLTAGEIWIYVNLQRRADLLTARYG